MTGLDKKEKAQVKSLMSDQRWLMVIKFAALKTDYWKDQAITGRTGFEELRSLHKRDGKIEGLIEFMDQLEKEAFDA